MKPLPTPAGNASVVPAQGLRHPTFGEAFRFWLKLGFISFGGPTGQIAIMHAELVEKKKWISEARFLHALNYCMLLPGPEAQQLATYVGWLLHKTWGGIVAGAFFVIPSIFILWGLSFIYAAFGNVPWIAAIFYGLFLRGHSADALRRDIDVPRPLLEKWLQPQRYEESFRDNLRRMYTYRKKVLAIFDELVTKERYRAARIN